MISRTIARLKRGVNFLVKGGSPDYMNVDVSGACNIRCRICVLDEKNHRKGMMPVGAFEKLLKESMKIPRIWLSGNCEPTLNPNLIEILRLCKKLRPEATIGFTTNALRLTESTALKVMEAKIDRIRIFLDGVKKATYEYVRRGAHFETVRRHLCKLAELRKERGYPLKIEVSMTAMKRNVEQLPDLVKFAAYIGIEAVIVNGLEPFNREMVLEKLWSYGDELPEKTVRARELFTEAAEIARSKGVKIYLPRLRPRRFRVCVLKGPIISWNGDVSPCEPLSYARTTHYEDETIQRPFTEFGNVNHAPLSELWYGKNYIQFRRRVMLGRLPEFCRRCLLKEGVLRPSREE